jgi:hypothetical protein
MKLIKAIAPILVAVSALGVASAEPPANSGVVVRDGYFFGFFDVDTDAGLSIVLGFDPSLECIGEASFDFMSYSDKILQGGLRVNTLEKGEVIASVWPTTDFDCDLFTTELPLALGLVRFSVHDNDLFGPQFCEEKNNINSFGYKANGTLYSPFGEMKQLNMHVWGLFDCDTSSLPLFKASIKLTD